MADSSAILQLGPISPAASGPLYQQIVDGIKREVLANRLTAGSALPSYRVLAEQLLVSLITVKRAYEELEREGITFSRQGLGTFVAARGNDRTRADEDRSVHFHIPGRIKIDFGTRLDGKRRGSIERDCSLHMIRTVRFSPCRILGNLLRADIGIRVELAGQ